MNTVIFNYVFIGGIVIRISNFVIFDHKSCILITDKCPYTENLGPQGITFTIGSFFSGRFSAFT